MGCEDGLYDNWDDIPSAPHVVSNEEQTERVQAEWSNHLADKNKAREYDGLLARFNLLKAENEKLRSQVPPSVTVKRVDDVSVDLWNNLNHQVATIMKNAYGTGKTRARLYSSNVDYNDLQEALTQAEELLEL